MRVRPLRLFFLLLLCLLSLFCACAGGEAEDDPLLSGDTNASLDRLPPSTPNDSARQYAIVTLKEHRDSYFVGEDAEHGILYLVKTMDGRRFEKNDRVTVWYNSENVRISPLEKEDPDYIEQYTVKKEVEAILIQLTPGIPGVDAPSNTPEY